MKTLETAAWLATNTHGGDFKRYGSSQTDLAPQGTLEIALLADDLSGACDAAAAFAARGLQTEVELGHRARLSEGTQVWCRSSESRDMTAARLEERLAAELSAMPRSRRTFKKIDSVFRGNTFEEIALMLRFLPDVPLLLAPAFPAAGRNLRDGVLRVADVSGVRTIGVLGELRGRGLAVANVPLGLSSSGIEAYMRREWKAGSRLLLCDAESQEDLEAIVLAGQAAAPEVLWIGAAGLAHALAKCLQGAGEAWKAPAARRGRVIFFIGSDHPVTLAQVEALRAHSRGAAHIHVFPVARTRASIESVRGMMSGFAAEEIGCMFITGGDTATLVCEALRIEALSVLAEFAPGLPHCQVVGGAFDGVQIVLKSGGFGMERVLCDLAERFGQQDRGEDSVQEAAEEGRAR